MYTSGDGPKTDSTAEESSSRYTCPVCAQAASDVVAARAGAKVLDLGDLAVDQLGPSEAGEGDTGGDVADGLGATVAVEVEEGHKDLGDHPQQVVAEPAGLLAALLAAVVLEEGDLGAQHLAKLRGGARLLLQPVEVEQVELDRHVGLLGDRLLAVLAVDDGLVSVVEEAGDGVLLVDKGLRPGLLVDADADRLGAGVVDHVEQEDEALRRALLAGAIAEVWPAGAEVSDEGVEDPGRAVLEGDACGERAAPGEPGRRDRLPDEVVEGAAGGRLPEVVAVGGGGSDDRRAPHDPLEEGVEVADDPCVVQAEALGHEARVVGFRLVGD